MLPDDAKHWKAKAKESLKQSSVDDHFPQAKPEEKPISYSDKLFREAAIEWLIETNQVCTTLFVVATSSCFATADPST